MGLFELFSRLRQHRRLTYAVIFAVFLSVLLAGLAGIGIMLAKLDVKQRVETETQGFDSFWHDVAETTEALRSPSQADTCSEPFLTWMRRVAFLPDGIHEIIFTRNGLMLCSVSLGRIEPPVALEAPDFFSSPGGVTPIWLDRDLSMLGLPDIVGSFAGFDDFILVVPRLTLAAPIPDWMDYEVVALAEDGTVRHRMGDRGLYSSVSGAPDAAPLNLFYRPGFSDSSCGATRTVCVAVSAPFGTIIERTGLLIAGGVLFAALLAGAITLLFRTSLERVWSLSYRLGHRLSGDTIVCHYQPLLDVKKDQFCGVEVLARCRDDDGRLLYPDEFLPIIEERGLHRAFTRLVVDRAYRDLCTLPQSPKPLKVHFNIFPCEFDVDSMLELFEDFLADRSRFTVVIELVESDALPIERTKANVARLHEAGILSYIDDFGEGYSSIGYLASLGTYGVKLDRSFGLAPEGSLMDAMLASAIEMVAKTGQVLVVEGVETASRMVALKANKNVSIVQGYFISRPIDIEALTTLFSRKDFNWNAEAA